MALYPMLELESGASVDGLTYHGILESVLQADGIWVPVRGDYAIGTDRGVGYVTARTWQSLMAGRFVDGRRLTPWRRLTRLWYRRDRPEGRYWHHDLVGTEWALTDSGPVFRPAGSVPYRCPMAGDYMCGG